MRVTHMLISKSHLEETLGQLHLLEASLNKRKQASVGSTVSSLLQLHLLPFATSFSMLGDMDCLFEDPITPNMFSSEDFKLTHSPVQGIFSSVASFSTFNAQFKRCLVRYRNNLSVHSR